MPQFKITASYTVFLTAEIEADTLADAQARAETMDGGDFSEVNEFDNDTWAINDVEEVQK